MLKKKDKYKVAVVGATGAVGSEVIGVLEERGFPVSDLVPLASRESEGEKIEFREMTWTVRRLSKDSFRDVDIAFFTAGAEQSHEFASLAVSAGAVVIDSSSAFRLDPKVPLVVPEVNGGMVSQHSGIIASPDPYTIGMSLVLKPIHMRTRVRRIVATVLESASGSGKKAMEELADQTVALLNFKEIEKKIYPHQIAFNCIPRIEAFEQTGRTKEESEISRGIRRVMQDESIGVAVTAVQAPVFRCHSGALNIETEESLSPNEARAILSSARSVIVFDDPSRDIYPMPIDVAGKDDIYVGRIRADESVRNGLWLWLVIDNIRKGSALNAVQIAEELVK